jgi:hypothetical protein
LSAGIAPASAMNFSIELSNWSITSDTNPEALLGAA